MSDTEKGPKQKRCFVGFDAFIDYITRPIAGRTDGIPVYFHDLGEYTAFLQGKDNKSFSLELEIPQTKIGGNNPNMSVILGGCGVDVVSFGAYGKTSIDPVFLPLAEKCRLVSFANPGKCTAYEFAVSKMMNFYNIDAGDFTWENLLKFISIEEIIAILDRTDMLIFVNLGEQPAVLGILEMLLKNVFPRFKDRKLFFMDFADCSHMSGTELSRSFDFMKKLGAFGELTLSVNENEFRCLSRHIENNSGEAKSTSAGLASFRKNLGADRVILRTLDTFYFSSSSAEIHVPNEFVESPAFLTGAGDAQNAGFCLGLLADMSIEEMLLTGVRAGNIYMRTGEVNPEYIF